MNDLRLAEIFKAFCDENRIKILKMLSAGEKCACKLLEELNVTQRRRVQALRYYS